MKKFKELQKDIGDELFNKLSPKQKKLIADTSGSIDLGDNVDIEKMYKDLNKIRG